MSRSSLRSKKLHLVQKDKEKLIILTVLVQAVWNPKTEKFSKTGNETFRGISEHSKLKLLSRILGDVQFPEEKLQQPSIDWGLTFLCFQPPIVAPDFELMKTNFAALFWVKTNFVSWKKSKEAAHLQIDKKWGMQIFCWFIASNMILIKLQILFTASESLSFVILLSELRFCVVERLEFSHSTGACIQLGRLEAHSTFWCNDYSVKLGEPNRAIFFSNSDSCLGI